MFISHNLQTIKSKLPSSVTLVAVSKNQPVEKILEAYHASQRIFGENRVPELVEKYAALPKDIFWHLIGHLQTNKVKDLVPFITLIHSVDSRKLLQEISKQAQRQNRIIDCLLQVKIAQEETKYGLSPDDVAKLLQEAQHLPNVRVIGLMGMATNTEDEKLIRSEFQSLTQLFQKLQKEFSSLMVLSIGMSHDYHLAVEEGSTMIRIGRAVFEE